MLFFFLFVFCFSFNSDPKIFLMFFIFLFSYLFKQLVFVDYFYGKYITLVFFSCVWTVLLNFFEKHAYNISASIILFYILHVHIIYVLMYISHNL